MQDANNSLAVLFQLADPEAVKTLKRFLVSNYDDWVDLLYEELDSAISRMQNGAPYYQQENISEDTLTHHLLNPLCQLGYDATHDTYMRGHVDLKIRFKNFEWLGEAKIYDSYSKLWQGFEQLTGRYSTGDVNKNKGGLLIYFYGKNCLRMMNAWKAKLSISKPKATYKECLKRPNLVFYSEHTHEVSGLSYSIRHIPVMLHYKPRV